MSAHEDGGAFDTGFGLNEGVGHPATFAVAGDVDALGVKSVGACEFIADMAEGFDFVGDAVRLDLVFSGLGVSHADDNPVAWSGVGSGALDHGFSLKAVVTENGWP